MPNRSEYHSFLLRLWRVNRENPWRISLTRVGGEEQYTFSRLEEMMEFLDAQVVEESQQEEGGLQQKTSLETC